MAARPPNETALPVKDTAPPVKDIALVMRAAVGVLHPSNTRVRNLQIRTPSGRIVDPEYVTRYRL
eukprot:990760-Prymnesium_polylepis.1